MTSFESHFVITLGLTCDSTLGFCYQIHGYELLARSYPSNQEGSRLNDASFQSFRSSLYCDMGFISKQMEINITAFIGFMLGSVAI